MKKVLFVFLCMLFVSSLYAKVIVATPIFPLFDIVKNIGGKDVSVIMLIKPGENPHHFEPGIQTIKQVKNATIYFGIDERFDGWVKRILPEKKIIFLNDYIKSDNPHIWLSFENLAKITKIIEDKLCEIDRDNCSIFRKNGEKYIAKFDSLKKRYKFRNIFVIECHPAWTQFLSEIGIKSVGYVKKGKEREPSIKTLKTLIRRAKLFKAKYLICSSNDKDKIHDKIKKLLNLKKIVLEPLGGFSPYDSLYELYRENLRKLDGYINGE